MPGRLRVRVHGARNLPVMDRAADTTDAYVEMHFGDTTYKTDVYAKSFSPQWNTDWFVFEEEDHVLQDNCLMFR
jgi:Ca2+-dependent lipid-binding protein